MTPEQAWQVAKAQLRMEMPKAAFDTWVRDTEYRTFDAASGLFEIAAPTAYTRDWLENRLTSTLTRLLTGILNRAVDVRFTAEISPGDVWETVLDELKRQMPQQDFDTWVRPSELLGMENGIAEIGVPNRYARDYLEDRLASMTTRILTDLLQQTVAVRFVVSAGGPAADTVEFQPQAYQSLYEQIVRPEQRVILPGYFRRHLRVTGPKEAWIYVSARQLGYRSGLRDGQGSGHFSAQAIAALSGVTRRTVQRTLESPKSRRKLAGLLWPLPDEPRWQTGDGAPRRMPRRYGVAMTLPLTAADACSLRRWLIANLERFDGPEGVLRAACQAPLDDLIPLDAQAPDDALPQTVEALVRDLFADTLPEATCQALAAQLQNHLMPPNDTIHITLFFLEHVLPYLGPGAAWLLVLLRDRCWVNPETGEARTRVAVPGGYAEMAAWLGIRRPKTVWEYLRPGTPLSLFVQPEVSQGGGGMQAVEVLLEEIPPWLLETALEPERWAQCQDLLQSAADGNPPSDAAWRECRYRLGAFVTIGLARLTLSLGAIVAIGMARLSPSHGANVAVKNSLNSLNQLLNSNTPQPGEDSSQARGAAPPSPQHSGGGGWDWDSLFAGNPEIPPKERAKTRHADPVDFALWLLYAYSPQGAGIKRPWQFALRRAQAGQMPPAAFRQFERYSSADLGSFLAYPTAGTPWEDLLPQNAQKRTELARRLGLVHVPAGP